jgi:hypothetical protein
MEAIDRRRKPVFVHMGVNFGCANTRVAKEFLNDTKISSARQKVGREGVSEKVRIDAGIQSCGLGCSFDNSPKVGSGESAPVVSEKDFSSRFRADKLGAGGMEITIQGFMGGRTQKDEALLISFANHTSASTRQIQLLDS